MIPGLKDAESGDRAGAGTKTAMKNGPATYLDQPSIVATTSRGPILRRCLPAVAGIAVVVGAGLEYLPPPR